MAELLVAVGFFAVAVLAILGLTLSVLRMDSKAAQTSAGTLVADQLLQQTVASVRADSPPNTKASFWGSEYLNPAWAEGVVLNNDTQFHYVIYATTVTDAGGTPVGSLASDNRLKKLDVRVWWFNESPTSRSGYGRLEAQVTQLVSEAETIATP